MKFIKYLVTIHFPVEMITLVDYESEKTNLKAGDSFTAIRKETIGENDYSFIDINGHPHYYDGCEIKKSRIYRL